MNKFVLIPHDEYSHLKDRLVNNKEKGKKHGEIDKPPISNHLNIDLNKNNDIKDYDKDTLEEGSMGIKAYSIPDQSQLKEGVLPPPGFPIQNKDREVFKHNNKKNYNRQEMEGKRNGPESGRRQSDEVDRYFKKIYYDTRNPASYSGIAKLYKYVKGLGEKKFQKNRLRSGLVNRNLIQHIDP